MAAPEPPRRVRGRRERRRAARLAAPADRARRQPPRYGRYVGLLALADPRADHDQHDRHQAERGAGVARRARGCRRSPRRSRSGNLTATPTSRPAPTRARRATCPRARCAARRSSTSASSTNAGRSCWRCSSTRGSCPAVLERPAGARADVPAGPLRGGRDQGRPRGVRRLVALARPDASRSASTATARSRALQSRQLPAAHVRLAGRRVQAQALLARPSRPALRARVAAARGGIARARARGGAGASAPRASPAGLARAGGRAGAAGAAAARQRGRGARARGRSPATRRPTSRRGCASSRTACAARARSALRREPMPAAYRVFFRHIGLDPDVAAHADRGGGARAHAARRLPHGRAARRRPADRADRHGRAGVGARRRPASTARSASARAARASALGRSREAPLLPDGRLVVADADGAASRCCSATVRRATSRAPAPSALRSSPCRLRACRTCTPRRPCGQRQRAARA